MSFRVLTAAIAVAAWSGPLHADNSSFVQAFANICVQHISGGLESAPQVFRDNGWIVTNGADPGEFEAYRDGTNAFLATSETGRLACTVMDENVGQADALDLMVRTLDLNFTHVLKGTSSYGGEVWRTLHSEGTLHFRTDVDLSGNGSAVLFELRP